MRPQLQPSFDFPFAGSGPFAGLWWPFSRAQFVISFFSSDHLVPAPLHLHRWLWIWPLALPWPYLQKIEQIGTGLQNILTASTQMHTNVQAGLCLCQTVSLTLRWSWNCEVHLGQVFLQLPLQLPWAHLVRKRQLAQQPYVTNFNWHGHGGVARQQQTCDTHH